MACCAVNLGWEHPGATTSPACRATSRMRSESLFSESDLEDLVAADLKLLQWGAKLRAGAMLSLASVPEGSIPRAQPVASRRLVKPDACDAGLFGITAAVAMGRWFSVSEVGVAPAAPDLAKSLPSRQHPDATDFVNGVVLMRGSFDAEGISSMPIALQHSLVEVLTQAAEGGVGVTVGSAKSAVRADLGTSMSSQAWMEFPFEASLADANDKGPILELLQLEAESGGAVRLLPELANASADLAAHLAVRLELHS